MIEIRNQYKIVPLFGAAYAAPNIGTTIYTNFPVLMSPLSQSSISEVDFYNLDQYFSLTFSPRKLLERLLKVLEFYSYLHVRTLVNYRIVVGFLLLQYFGFNKKRLYIGINCLTKRIYFMDSFGREKIVDLQKTDFM